MYGIFPVDIGIPVAVVVRKGIKIGPVSDFIVIECLVEIELQGSSDRTGAFLSGFDTVRTGLRQAVVQYERDASGYGHDADRERNLLVAVDKTDGRRDGSGRHECGYQCIVFARFVPVAELAAVLECRSIGPVLVQLPRTAQVEDESVLVFKVFSVDVIDAVAGVESRLEAKTS